MSVSVINLFIQISVDECVYGRLGGMMMMRTRFVDLSEYQS